MTLFRPGFLILALSIQLTACASASTKPSILPELKNLIPETSINPIDFADSQLLQSGISADFILKIHRLYIDKNKNWQESVNRIVELNMFGFLGQSNYSLHNSPRAQRKIKLYLRDHAKTFQITRKKYPVSSAAIASLLWVETQHGKTMGTFPIPWVFYALVMGSHPKIIHSMLSLVPGKLAKGNPKGLSEQIAQEKIIERSKSKATWALEELKAIQQIQDKHYFDPFKHKASFAGAFGIPQFIPSTYLKLATSEFRAKPDLFKHSDAILSVAHFLISNGWKDEDSNANSTALYAYNRSKDYGAVILQLEHEVKVSSKLIDKKH